MALLWVRGLNTVYVQRRQWYIVERVITLSGSRHGQPFLLFFVSMVWITPGLKVPINRIKSDVKIENLWKVAENCQVKGKAYNMCTICCWKSIKSLPVTWVYLFTEFCREVTDIQIPHVAPLILPEMYKIFIHAEVKCIHGYCAISLCIMMLEGPVTMIDSHQYMYDIAYFSLFS